MSLHTSARLSDDVRAFLVAPLDVARQTETGTWVHDREPDAFTGRLAVLTDGGSTSATCILLDLVTRHHRRAGRDVWFAGEPPGCDAGGRMSAGQTLTLVLLNSGQRLTVPLLGSRMFAAETPDGTHVPDTLVAPTGADVAAGADPVMAAVRVRVGL